MKVITESGYPLRGTVSLPGDKSISHRAALFGALATGHSHIENFLVAGVTEKMLDALTALGVSYTLNGTTLDINGKGFAGIEPAEKVLHCGNSATTMRLLIGALAGIGLPAKLDGSEGLRSRPMGRVVNPLREMGAQIETTEAGTAPLQILGMDGKHLQGRNFALPVASAQVKTALMLAALQGNSPTTILEPGPSRDHSERMLASMGASIETVAQQGKPCITVEPLQKHLTPLEITVPGDFSSAAFLIVAALVTPGSEIVLQGVGLNPTRTGLLDVLHTMGAQIEILNAREQHNEPVGDIVVRHSRLHGIEVSGSVVVRMIDEFPVFAVAAAYAEGQTVVKDAVELRHKESNRISMLCAQLTEVGISVREQPDGFVIDGGAPVTGGIADPHSDHRLAMSLLVAGLDAQGPVSVQHAEIINESFPQFLDSLTHLGARFDVV
ncbi:MAG: 3-phosphoshikimate 1-carboxyvinyltransferase [Anaerolineales bacterium]|nr:3-phosphoshikimate 1-carboxyvinyltransferase [Anaerolineales bacterium]